MSEDQDRLMLELHLDPQPLLSPKSKLPLKNCQIANKILKNTTTKLLDESVF